MTSDQASDAEKTPDVSPEALRVMANAFRARVYDQLLIFGDSTARKLAKIVHLSEASVNQHMREMERIEWVRKVNPDAPARQVVWHAKPGGMRLGDLTEQEKYASEARAWLRSTIEAEARVLQDWIDASPSWPVEWRKSVERWDYVLKALTVEQLQEVAGELNALGHRWLNISKDQERSGVPGARPVYLVTHAVPWPMDYEEDAGSGSEAE